MIANKKKKELSEKVVLIFFLRGVEILLIFLKSEGLIDKRDKNAREKKLRGLIGSKNLIKFLMENKIESSAKLKILILISVDKWEVSAPSKNHTTILIKANFYALSRPLFSDRGGTFSRSR